MRREGTYESGQPDPEFTGLLNDALGRAKMARCDDPVVGPLNIEDTAHGLQKIVHKKCQLSHDYELTLGCEDIERRTIKMSAGRRSNFQPPLGGALL